MKRILASKQNQHKNITIHYGPKEKRKQDQNEIECINLSDDQDSTTYSPPSSPSTTPPPPTPPSQIISVITIDN